jgi:hypothetical protein
MILRGSKQKTFHWFTYLLKSMKKRFRKVQLQHS